VLREWPTSASTLGNLLPPPTNLSTAGRSFLPTSSCRHEDRTVPSFSGKNARRAVSEDPDQSIGFLLIVRTGRVVTELIAR
jgi:hypothetical protein